MADQRMNSSTSDSFSTFGHFADGLNEAITEFKKLQSTEAVTTILAGLRPLMQYGRRALGFTADYSRRHPMRVALTVAALGLVLANIAKPSEPKPEALH